MQEKIRGWKLINLNFTYLDFFIYNFFLRIEIDYNLEQYCIMSGKTNNHHLLNFSAASDITIDVNHIFIRIVLTGLFVIPKIKLTKTLYIEFEKCFKIELLD